MKFRQADTSLAAAKTSFSTSTAYRFEKDPRLPSQKKETRTAAAGPAGRYLRGGDRADAEGRSRPSVHRHFRRDAQTPS